VAIGCDEAKGKVVGYSEPLPDPNFQAIEAIMKKHLGQFGAELRPVNANLNPGKQISDIQSLIQAKVAVLIANPVDPNATKPAFDAARKAGIPVIAQETKIGGPFFSNVGADVEAAAAGGAEVLAEMAKGGKVAAVLGPPFAEVLVRENTAFKAKAKELGIDVVEEKVNQQITPQAAKGFADAWKQKYGADLKGVWTFNDVSAIGVASSIGGTFNPVIASINAQPDALPLVKAGKIAATFDIQQDKLAQALAYAALAAICGQDAPEEIVIPVKRVDKSNVDSHRPLSERVNDEFKVEFEERDGRTFMKTD
jgi:ribose transport system substrate-binding protein